MKNYAALGFGLALIISYASATELQRHIELDAMQGRSMATSVRNAYNQSSQGVDVSRAIGLCRSVTQDGQLAAVKADKDNLSPARRKAIEILHSRCSGFDSFDLGQKAEQQARVNALQAGDPQTVVVSRFTANSAKLGDASIRRGVVTDILRLQDATVLEELGIKLFAYRSADKGPYAYFKGKEYSLRTDPEIAYAVSLVKCELGKDCGSTETQVLMTCAYQGECFPSLSELVLHRAQLAGKNTKLVEQLAKEIASAFRQRDVNAFVQPY